MFLTTFDRLAPEVIRRKPRLLDRFRRAYITLGVGMVGYASGTWVDFVWEVGACGDDSSECVLCLGVFGSWVGFSYLYFVV